MQKRPINLNLLNIRFPITAWVSGLHRFSGLLIFLLIPYLLWMLQESLISETNFLNLKQQWTEPFPALLLWIFLIGLICHLVAGIRHLLLDKHIGESERGGKLGASLVILLSAIFIAIAVGYSYY